MRRGPTLAVGAALVAVLAICGATIADPGDPADPLGPPASVVVAATALPSPPVPASFVGISLELDAVPAFLGADPAHPDPVILQLLRNLAPGQAPVVRIGGDSADYSWWPEPGLRRPAGVHYALTPRWMATLRSFAQALGAHLILGLNWAARDPALTLAEARAYVAGIGMPLTFELGNEPTCPGM